MIFWASGAESGNIKNWDFYWGQQGNIVQYPAVTTDKKHSGSYSYVCHPYTYNGWITKTFGIQIKNILDEVYISFWIYYDEYDHYYSYQSEYVVFTNYDCTRNICFGTLDSLSWNKLCFWTTTNGLNFSSNTPITDAVALTDFIKNQWVCWELHVKIGILDGKLEFKENGVTKISYSGDTYWTDSNSFGHIDRILFSGGGSNPRAQNYIDDIVIADTTGDVNNTWLGQDKMVMNVPAKRNSLDKNMFDATADKVSIANTSGLDWFPGSNFMKPVNSSDTQLFDCVGLTRLTDKTKDIKICAVILTTTINNYRTDITNFRFVISNNMNNYEYELNFLNNGVNNFFRQVWNLNPITNTTFKFKEINKYEYGVKVE